MSTLFEVVNPGASDESVLVTDSSVNNDQMSSSLEEIKNSNSIQNTLQETLENCNIDNLDDSSNIANDVSQDDDYMRNKDWLDKKKHIFVLSSAGKPIYSRYGNEDKLATLYGVMQALVSFVQDQNDSIHSIHAGDTTYVFLIKSHLILVSISKTKESVPQLVSQLTYVFNQIASILTLTRLNIIYEQRRNYDLRRLLSGVERLIDNLLDFSEREPAFTLGAIQCLSLSSSVRDQINSAITNACSKIKNLVFAILIGNNKLITLVRMKKYSIHPGDLHLIFNLVQASESLKTAESWTPLCLPQFDASGFLYGHVSYLAEDCQACLLLLTVERDVFFVLSEAKQRIVEKLRRSNCLEAINESLGAVHESCVQSGFPELRHYIYKCKATAQFYQPAIGAPYTLNNDRLVMLYKRAHQRLHCNLRPLKLIFERGPQEAILAWETRAFELYVVLEPLIPTENVIANVSRVLSWLKKKEDRLFLLNAPTF